MEIGTLTARMVMDVSSLQTAQASMAAFEKSATRSLNVVAQRIRTFGYLSTAVISVPMVMAGKATAKMASDFEFSMQKIVGLAGVAQSSINSFKKEILALAPAVGKGPKELADALYFINSSGIKGAEALNVLKLSAKAAASGLGEAQAVANVLTSVLSAYKGTGITAAYATDVLIAAIREGKAEAAGFTTSIGQVIPIAVNLGVAFDQVAGAMAALTLNGASAANAAVYLKGMFQSLTIASEKGDAALAKYVSSYADLRNILKTQGIISLLKEVNRLRDEAEKSGKGRGEEFLSDIFPNVRGLTAVLGIAGKNFEYTTELMKRVTESTGSLGVAFAAVSDTIKMRYDKAIAKINVSQISLGTSIANTFIPILESIARTVEKVTKWFENLSDAQKRHKIIILAVVAALGPLSLITSSIIYSIGGLITALKLANTALVFLAGNAAKFVNFLTVASTASLAAAGWIMAVVVAVGALTYSIYKLIQRQRELKGVDQATVEVNALFADSERDVAREIGAATAKIEVLKRVLTDANIPAEVRAKLLKDTNDQYKDLLPYLLTEKTSFNDIATALGEVNKKLEESILLNAQMKLAEALGTKQADVMMGQLDLLMKRGMALKEITELQDKVKKGSIDMENLSGFKKANLAVDISGWERDILNKQNTVEQLNKALTLTGEKLAYIKSMGGVLAEQIAAGYKKGPMVGLGGKPDPTPEISYWQDLQNKIDTATENLKAFTEAEIKAGKGAKDLADLEKYTKAQQGILGKVDKGAVKDISDFYATKKQLAENSARAIYTIEEELATKLAAINIENKRDLVNSEKDKTKKAKLSAELDGMIIDEANRQKKVAADKLFDEKEKLYAIEAEKAKQRANLEITDADDKARAIEAIEIDQAQKHIWLMEAIYHKNMMAEQDLLDIRKENNSLEYKDLVDAKARESAEFNDSYLGRKALLDKELQTGKKVRREYNLALRDLTVEFYDFTKVSATENAAFLKGMSREELNWYINALDNKIAFAKDAEADITEIQKLEEQKRLAEFEKRFNAEERKIKSFNEVLQDAMESLGQQISQGAETWKEYGKAVVDALKQTIAMIIKEGVAIAVRKTLEKYSGIDPFVAIGLSGLAGGLAAGAFSTAINQISIPGLADGGAIYGPTILQAGEYPGASTDPEHFIRQSHLESLVESAGGTGYIAETELSGRVVKILLKREERYQNRGR